MQQVDLILNARWVIPIAPINTTLDHYSVVIQAGRIVELLPTAEVDNKYRATETVNLGDHALMPGLVNAHTHAPMNLFRGLADDLKLMDWLNNHIWPAEANIINAASIVDGSRLAIAEMLRGGTTCFNDMYFFPNEIASTAIEEGIRGCIGHTIMSPPTGWAKDEDEYIRKAVEAHQARPDSPLINWTISPHAPYTNSDHSLKLAKNLADELALRMNIHLHETQDELNIEFDAHGKRPLQRLNDLGLLGPNLTAIHMVHLSDQDIHLSQQTGISIVHCPQSNMKLASGFAPVKQLLDAGINVAIGTDGAASNNDLDMFSELHSCALVAKAVNKDPTAIDAATALKMATLNGAKAIGLGDEIGSLEVGKAADIIAVDLSSYLTQPVYNPISVLAYSVSRLQVSDVWIAGNALLRNHDFTRLDSVAATARAKEWASKCEKFKASKGASR